MSFSFSGDAVILISNIMRCGKFGYKQFTYNCN